MGKSRKKAGKWQEFLAIFETVFFSGTLCFFPEVVGGWLYSVAVFMQT